MAENTTMLPHDIQTRDEDDVRYVSGIAVPWNVEITYAGEKEMFESGSLKPAPDPMPLRWQHDGISVPIGIVERTENRPEGLWVDCRLYDTDAAKGAWNAAKDGIAKGFSIEFENDEPGPGIMSGVGAQGDVRNATMFGLSLVEQPAYKEAVIQSVRNADDSESILAIYRDWSQYYDLTDPTED